MHERLRVFDFDEPANNHFKKFRACINVQGVNDHRADRNAIDIVYKSLQRDREQADISDVIRRLHEVVDEAIEVRSNRTTVQILKDTVEKKLWRLLAAEPAAYRFPEALRRDRGGVQPREGPRDHRAHLRGVAQAYSGAGEGGKPRESGKGWTKSPWQFSTS